MPDESVRLVREHLKEPAIPIDPIVENLLDAVRPELGYREGTDQYTKFGEWYATNVDQDSAFKTAPWCDMFIAWAANQAGVQRQVGEFALTTKHAAWFKKQDAWSDQPEPGALVFFDWSGAKRLDGIDHVGIVEKVVDGKLHTIEANVDRVWLKRKVRDESKVVGYGLPWKVQVTSGNIPVDAVSGEQASLAGTNAATGGNVSVGSMKGSITAAHERTMEGLWTPGDALLPAGLLLALVSTALTGLRFRTLSKASAGRHRRRGRHHQG